MLFLDETPIEKSIRGSIPDFAASKLHIVKGKTGKTIKELVGEMVVEKLYERGEFTKEETEKLQNLGYLEEVEKNRESKTSSSH